MQIVRFRLHGTTESTQALIDAPTKTDAWHIAVRELATIPGSRSASFDIEGRATAAQRKTLPTLTEAIARLGS